jgi:hypothetical protein
MEGGEGYDGKGWAGHEVLFFYLGFCLHIFDRTEGTKANGMT